MRTLQAAAETFTGTVLTPDSDLGPEQIQERIQSSEWVVIPIVSEVSASKGRSGISSKLEDIGRRIITAAKKASKPTVVISFDSPYILELFRDADVCIAGYDSMNEIQEAAVDMLIER